MTDAVEDMSRNFENSLLDYSSKRIMRSSNASIRGLAGHKDNNVKKGKLGFLIYQCVL